MPTLCAHVSENTIFSWLLVSYISRQWFGTVYAYKDFAMKRKTKRKNQLDILNYQFFGSAAAAVALLAVPLPFATAQNVDTKVTTETTTSANADGSVTTKMSTTEIKEFEKVLTKGYKIPEDRYSYLQPVPKKVITTLPAVPEGREYRYFGGKVYVINPAGYEVVDVISVNNGAVSNSTQTTTSTDVDGDGDFDVTTFKKELTPGYVIPQKRYTYLKEVPKTVITQIPAAPEGVVYRYLDGTVYSVNPETYKVIDVISVKTNTTTRTN